MTKSVVLHLVSPSSGELVELLARSVIGQLEGLTSERHLWNLVRSPARAHEVLAEIAKHRGFVFHSLADDETRQAFEDGCRLLDIPYVFVLEPFVTTLAAHTGAKIRFRASARVLMDEEYGRRLEAMRFTLAHDDGLGLQDLDHAEVVLVGVSRATKTPTCMYLAHRGIRAANVPLVPGAPLPEALRRAKSPLIVGLTIDPERLARVREQRLSLFKQKDKRDYFDIDAISREVLEARRVFARHGWPVIDVTQQPIEQTAAVIMDVLKRRSKTQP